MREAPQRCLSTYWPYLIYTGFLLFMFAMRQGYMAIWTDEVFTLYQSNAPTFVGFWQEFGAKVQVLSYGYFLLLWLIGQVFELTPLVLRLPNLFFLLIALFLLHRFLSRHFGEIIAFLACICAFVLTREMELYISEARPYALYLLAASIQVVYGLKILEKEDPGTRDFVILGLTAFLMPASHTFGIFFSAATAVSMGLLRFSDRRFLLKMSAAFLGGWVIFLATHLSLLLPVFTDPVPRWTELLLWRDYLLQYTDPFLMTSQSMVLVIVLLVICVLAGPDKQLPALDFSYTGRGIPYIVLTGFMYILTRLGLEFLYQIQIYSQYWDRYTLPVLVGQTCILATLLAVFRNVLDEPLPLWKKFASPSLQGKTVLLGLGAVFLLSSCVSHFLRNLEVKLPLTKDLVREGWFPGIAELKVPVVFANHSPFLEYHYYSEAAGNLYLLRERRETREDWTLLEPSIQTIIPQDLLQWEKFALYVSHSHKMRQVPSFQLGKWGKDQGYRVVNRFDTPRGFVLLYSQDSSPNPDA